MIFIPHIAHTCYAGEGPPGFGPPDMILTIPPKKLNNIWNTPFDLIDGISESASDTANRALKIVTHVDKGSQDDNREIMKLASGFDTDPAKAVTENSITIKTNIIERNNFSIFILLTSF
jgi:hypothetical protein